MLSISNFHLYLQSFHSYSYIPKMARSWWTTRELRSKRHGQPPTPPFSVNARCHPTEYYTSYTCTVVSVHFQADAGIFPEIRAGRQVGWEVGFNWIFFFFLLVAPDVEAQPTAIRVGALHIIDLTEGWSGQLQCLITHSRQRQWQYSTAQHGTAQLPPTSVLFIMKESERGRKKEHPSVAVEDWTKRESLVSQLTRLITQQALKQMEKRGEHFG